MCFKNTKNSYGVVAKTFHWLMFLLIAGLIAVGFIMESMVMGPDKFKLIGLHKSTGIVVLLLALLRLMWKAANVTPLLPAKLHKLEKFMANSGHALLYVLMILTPLSGWAMSSAAGFPVSVFGWFTLPDFVAPDPVLKHILVERHELLAWSIIVVVSLHVVAALLHHFYYKNNVLVRMLPFVKDMKYATDSDTATGC